MAASSVNSTALLCSAVVVLPSLLTNIAVDITAIAVSVGLVKRDLDAQEGRMARMEIGAKLAGLKVRLQTKEDLSTVTLAALRRDRGRDKRVAVLVGGADAVKSSLESALPYGAALETSDILIVPLVLESRSGMSGGGAKMFQASGAENDLESAVGRAHVALPVAINRWQEWIDTEVRVTMAGLLIGLFASMASDYLSVAVDPARDAICTSPPPLEAQSVA